MKKKNSNSIQTHKISTKNKKRTNLAIEGGGVMSSPEKIKQSFIATLFRVILNPNHLRMVRSTRTHILVRGIMQIPLSITYFSLGNTRDSLISQFHSPETTCTELRELLSRGWNIIVGSLCYGRCRVCRGVGRIAGTESELVEPAHPCGGKESGGLFGGIRVIMWFEKG